MKKFFVLLVALVSQIVFAQNILPVGSFQIVNDGIHNTTFTSNGVAKMDMGYDGTTGYINFGAHTGNGQNHSILYMRGKDGNVGIGTSNPSSKLEVVGQINSFGVSSGQFDVNTSTKNFINFSGNNHGSVLISSNLYFSDDGIMKIANTHSTMSGSAILFPGNFQPNQGKILFYTSNPASVTENQVFSGTIAMEITGDGNIGIGKSNPTNKLDVKGTIHSQEVKVDMTGWSDFVFKKEYNLPTLEVVEKHIVEKGHLENIPSEEEVLKDGINLGEMNAKLLQKIEELTLYMIEQEKKNILQSKEIDILKKENQNFQMIVERVVKLENQSK